MAPLFQNPIQRVIHPPFFCMKTSSNTYLGYLGFYRSLAGRKLYLFMALSLVASILEGLGISAVIPLLNLYAGAEGNTENLLTKAFDRLFSAFGVDASLVSALGLILVLFSLKFIIDLAQKATSSYIYSWLREHIERELVDRFGKIDYLFFSSSETGYFNNVISREAGTVSGAFRAFVAMSIAGFSLLVYLTFSFYINWVFTTVVIICGAVLNFAFVRVRAVISRLSIEMTKQSGRHQTVLIQLFQNFKYLKVTGQIQSYSGRFFRVLGKLRGLWFRSEAYNAYTDAFFDYLKIVIICGTVMIMFQFFSSNLASVVVPLLFMNRALTAVMTYQANWQKFLTSTGSISVVIDAFEKFNSHCERSAGHQGGTISGNELKLQNVSFGYRESEWVLKDISLIINPGETVGIVGRSGAGKTTLVDVLSGLYGPTQGEITIGGVSYGAYGLDLLREKIGYISQTPVVFDGSIRANVAMDASVDKQKVREVLEFSHLLEFVEALPEAEETLVGHGGAKLSGGQKQRLAIAREVIRNPDILIFDEATSALDSITENIIQDSIMSLRGRKTIIIVAHRLSTLKLCDRIIVLEGGTVVESGSWVELKEKDGHFYELCRSQGIA